MQRTMTWRGKVTEEERPARGEQEKVSWCPEEPIWLCHQRQLEGDGFFKQFAKFPAGLQLMPSHRTHGLGSRPQAFFGTSYGGSFLLGSVVWNVELLRTLSIFEDHCLLAQTRALGSWLFHNCLFPHRN